MGGQRGEDDDATVHEDGRLPVLDVLVHDRHAPGLHAAPSSSVTHHGPQGVRLAVGHHAQPARRDQRVRQAVERAGEPGQVRRLRCQLGQGEHRPHGRDLDLGAVRVPPEHQHARETQSRRSRVETQLGGGRLHLQGGVRRGQDGQRFGVGDDAEVVADPDGLVARVAELPRQDPGRRGLAGAGRCDERDARAGAPVRNPRRVQHQQPPGVAGDRALGDDRAQVVQQMLERGGRRRALEAGPLDDRLVVVQDDVHDRGVGVADGGSGAAVAPGVARRRPAAARRADRGTARRRARRGFSARSGAPGPNDSKALGECRCAATLP